MLKPTRRAVHSLPLELASRLAAQHFAKIMWFLSLLAAGVAGWVLG
jgi:hypothetical protein